MQVGDLVRCTNVDMHVYDDVGLIMESEIVTENGYWVGYTTDMTWQWMRESDVEVLNASR